MKSQIGRGEVDNEEFYKILGVPKDASEGDIKKVRATWVPGCFLLRWYVYVLVGGTGAVSVVKLAR